MSPYGTVYKSDPENFPPHIDEFQFCDEDIREAFEGTSYVVGSPLTVQLTREIRKLREVLESKPDNKTDDIPLDTTGCYGYGGWGKW